MMEPRAFSWLAAVIATLLLAACTPTQWERNGLALDDGGTDWNDCHRQSIAYSNRWGYYDSFPRAFIARDAHGRAYTYYRPSPFPNRFMLEQDYLDRCLRGRGFQRVPLQPTTAVPAAMANQPACASDKRQGQGQEVRDCPAPVAAKPANEIDDAMNRGNLP